MAEMRKTRLVNNSIYYYIADVLATAGYPAVNLYDAYPNVDEPDFRSNLPSVSVSIIKTSGDWYELGNTGRRVTRTCAIDIFTESQQDGQLADLCDLIKDFLEGQLIDLYNYNLSTPTVIGKIEIEDVLVQILTIVPEIYNQAIITFEAIVFEG